MANTKRILISNDDGITSPGLVKLVEAAVKFGEVWVVAPDGQRSAMSHRITYFGGIKVKPYDFPVKGVKAFACSGTPADCVRVGVLKLMPQKPDFVFSGINDGYNMAGDIQYSGTAAAAFEGAFWNIHSIAFSQEYEGNLEVTDKYLSELMEEFMNKPLGKNQIWNVNFPGCKLEECKGVLRDRTVSADPFYADEYSMEQSPEDPEVQILNVEPKRNCDVVTKGTDLEALLQKYVSVGIVNNVR